MAPSVSSRPRQHERPQVSAAKIRAIAVQWVVRRELPPLDSKPTRSGYATSRCKRGVEVQRDRKSVV